MPDDMRGTPADMIHQGDRIGGHLLRVQSFARRLAASNAAVIEAQAGVVLRVSLHLRIQHHAMSADAHDHHERRARPVDPVAETASLKFE